jgi:hypothetical protein
MWYKTGSQECVARTYRHKNSYGSKRVTISKKKNNNLSDRLQYKLEKSENDENTEVFEAAAVSTF